MILRQPLMVAAAFVAFALPMDAAASVPRILIFTDQPVLLDRLSGPPIPHLQDQRADGIPSAEAADVLDREIALTDLDDIADLLSEVVQSPPIPRQQLTGRPFINIGLFWGPGWGAYVRNGHSVGALTANDADQDGRFFPEWNGRAAAIDLPWSGDWPRRVQDRTLTLLKGHGIPTRIPEQANGSASGWWAAALGLALLAVGTYQGLRLLQPKRRQATLTG
jgi:hypothetical protein